jgi:hypothetical protein
MKETEIAGWLEYEICYSFLSSSLHANESAGKKEGNSLPTSVSSRIDAQAAVLHESLGKDKMLMFKQSNLSCN